MSEDVEWIHLAQDKIRCLGSVNRSTVHKRRGIS